MEEKDRFVIKKNTLPYHNGWAVMDTQTGNKVGEYKTAQLAEIACDNFRMIKLIESGLPNQNFPSGDPLPKQPRHSNKRLIKLD